jgi:hypothetical protein
MVILLALVATIAIAVILSRTGVSGTAVNQQVLLYQRHHLHAGMREMVDRWLATTHGSLQDQLESDGQAFTIELPRGQRVRVSVTDGQGTVLDDLRGLYGPEARYTAMALDYLRRTTNVDADPDLGAALFRKAGPAQISINSAPPLVVEALTLAIVPGREGQRLAQEYINRRNRQLLVLADVRTIAADMGIHAEEIASLERMFVAAPTVWFVDAVMFSGGRASARSGGLIEIVTDPNSATTGVGSRTRFLTWEDIPLE